MGGILQDCPFFLASPVEQTLSSSGYSPMLKDWAFGALVCFVGWLMLRKGDSSEPAATASDLLSGGTSSEVTSTPPLVDLVPDPVVEVSVAALEAVVVEVAVAEEARKYWVVENAPHDNVTYFGWDSFVRVIIQFGEDGGAGIRELIIASRESGLEALAVYGRGGESYVSEIEVFLQRCSQVVAELVAKVYAAQVEAAARLAATAADHPAEVAEAVGHLGNGLS